MTLTVPLLDVDVRTRIENDLDTSFVVEAAAGTGKTTTLIRRMVAGLRTGRLTLDRLVAVTFTESAAGELKLRLRTAIEQALQKSSGEAEENLRHALPQLEEARIGTIHSLCSDLLRERPVEAELDPQFEVASEGATAQLFSQAFDRWFQAQLANPSEGVRRFLRYKQAKDTTPRRVLKQAALNLCEWRDFDTDWTRPAWQRDAWIDRLLSRAEALGRFASEGAPGDKLTLALREIERFSRDVARTELIRGSRDYEGLEGQLFALRTSWKWKDNGAARARHRFGRDEVLALRQAMKDDLDDFCAAAGADLAALLQVELRGMIFDFESLKTKAGKVDFQDLLLRTRDLLAKNRTVRAELQARYTHVFVDEFQDTDPLQVDILLLLAADSPEATSWREARPVPGKLFLVGDPKQSIYRFRRADVGIYQSVKAHLASHGAVVLPLQVSFRSRPEVQAFVNAAFSRRMGEQAPHQAAYVELLPYRTERAGQPAVVALPVPSPYSPTWPKVNNKAVEDSYPQAVAAYVHWLVHESGWTVTERDGQAPVPIAPRHICLLFKRFRAWTTDLTSAYVSALEAQGIGHVLVGGSSFHLREEVAAIRNALTAIEWPDDELSVYATLHGPLFALQDGHLLAFRERYGRLHPYRQVDDPDLALVSASLSVLRDLHRGRNRRPVAATISRLLAATRAHVGIAIWPNGEQALANVTRLMDMARRAEQDGLTSFRAFVSKLHDDAEHGEASEAPILEEGTEGVRLMTVHKAKGLEFPVVILCDPTARETPETPSRWVDPERRLCALKLGSFVPTELADHVEEELEREREEAVRLLYVACTRARDLLVVPAVGDGPQDTWCATLNPVVHPLSGRARNPLSNPAPGCPEFGDDSVRERPFVRPDSNVAPGEHRPEHGTHTVVWWDPGLLKLTTGPRHGLRQDRLLKADASGQRSQAGIHAHQAWQVRRQEVRSQAAAPTLNVTTATAMKDEESPPSGGVEVFRIGHDHRRPHGTRFGTLVHAILSQVDLCGDAMHVSNQTGLCGRLLGATDEEVQAAERTVLETLRHPLMQAAAASPECRREVPILAPLPDGRLMEGVIDVAYRTDAGWTVVDFKTDLEMGDRLEEYQRQVAAYVTAVLEATGQAVQGVLLQI